MPSTCVICGQRLAPRQWWNPVSPVVHDTPSGECPVLLAKREKLRRLEARPDAATLRGEIRARLGHDEHCPKACCLDCAAHGCNCETAEITDAVMAVLAEHGLVEP